MDSYNALMTSLYNARWNDMCEPKTLDDIFEAIRKAANKGKFGIIYFGDYHKPEFVPELEADSYLVDNYGDYIGIYW